jgi:hypothetical protein
MYVVCGFVILRIQIHFQKSIFKLACWQGMPCVLCEVNLQQSFPYIRHESVNAFREIKLYLK